MRTPRFSLCSNFGSGASVLVSGWITIAAALVCLLAVSTAGAAIIHVPEDYPTIQAGINAAVSGDIVMVAAGEYFEEITLKAGVIVQGAGEGESIINGGGNSGDVVRATGNDITNSAKLIGFTVTGAISGGGMPGGGGVFCNSGASPEIANNRFTGNDFGVVTWNNAAPSVHNNVVVHNTYMGVSISSRPVVINNTIAYNNIGVDDCGGYRPPVMNNIVTNNTAYGMNCCSTSVPTDFSYNDVWGNGTNYRNCGPGPGDISENPLYRDFAAGDYHLSPGSPCINAGNPLPQYNDPDGTRNDMGAYGGPGAVSEAPQISFTTPAQNALDVARDTNVSAVFTVDMDPATIDPATFLVRGDNGGFKTGTVNYDAGSRTATIDLGADFVVGEAVTALLTHDVAAAGGETLAGFAWQFTCGVQDGSGEFLAYGAPYVGQRPVSIVSADLDRDGLADLACTRSYGEDVAILLGQGNGDFTLQGYYRAVGLASDLVAADFNRDGVLDLAVGGADGSDVAVLLGNGDGSFGEPIPHSVGVFSPSVVDYGDFDADGNLDLAALIPSTDQCAIMLGVGDGSLTGPTFFTVGDNPSGISIGDLNTDGALDIVTANQTGNTISVLQGDGRGGFATAANFGAGSSPCDVFLGDLNADGVLDAVVANRSVNQISIMLGDGAGGFGARTWRPVQTAPCAVRLMDLDADGSLDLAVANSGSDSVSILLGNGDGTFGAVSNFGCGDEPVALTSGDFDGDGDLDLGPANDLASTISILLNKNALGVAALVPRTLVLHAPLDTDLAATFDAPADPATLNGASVRLFGAQSGPHSGIVTYDAGSFTVTLDPTDNLVDGELASACLTTAIVAGNGVGFGGYCWNFTAQARRNTEGNFTTSTSYAAGNDARGAFAADYDGDGDIDLAVCVGMYPSPGSIAILMNRGDGTFAAPVPYSLGSPDPIDVFAADLDGDGDIDLAVSHNEPGTSHLKIMSNNGAGVFTLIGSYAPAMLGQNVSGGDLDADGDIDLIMTDGWGSANNVHVLYNAGNASFPLTRTYSAGTYAHGVVAADADNDGDLDLEVGNPGDSNVSVLLNDGAGDFPEMHNYPLVAGTGPICANDFNGDGWLDIAGGGSAGVGIILNQGNGSFGAPQNVPISGSIYGINWADVDGDGDLDLAAGNFSDNALWVAKNAGNGSFTSATPYTVGTGPWDVQAADFNGDAALDLAVSCYSSDNVALIYNVPSAGIGDGEAAPAVARLTITPNPFRATTSIVYRGRGASLAAIDIFDVSGRLIRRLSMEATAPGIAQAVWDGTDDSGRPVQLGTYFCRPAGGGGAERIIVVR